MSTGSLARKITTVAVAAAMTAGLAVGGAAAASADDSGQAGTAMPNGSTMHGPRGGGPLAGLVSAGTITSTQARAVLEALHASHEEDHADHMAQMKADRDAALKTLVSNGTLTQAQADAIASADRSGLRTLIANGTVTRDQLSALHDEMETARDAHKAAMEAERATERAAVLVTLVNDGTITATQSTAISATLAERPADMGDHGRHGGRGGRH